MTLLTSSGYQTGTARILREGILDLSESQIIYLDRWEKELWPLLEQYTRLVEQDLTGDQISDIFKNAEKFATDAGSNRTALGAIGSAAKVPIDIAKKVNDKIDELGRLAKETGPVKNMDQKFNALKAQIRDKNSDSKIVQGIEAIGKWAKENPTKSSLAVGILTAIAAFAGGPAGGAAAGMILRATKDLLQGSDLSSAVGKSVKTGAVGFLAGQTFRYLSADVIDNFQNATDEEIVNMSKEFKKANFEDARQAVYDRLGLEPAALKPGSYLLTLNDSFNMAFVSFHTAITPEQDAIYKSLDQAISQARGREDKIRATVKLWDWLAGVQANPENIKLTALAQALKEIPRGVLTTEQAQEILTKSKSSEETLNALKGLSSSVAAIVQGALQAAGKNAKKSVKAEPVDTENKNSPQPGTDDNSKRNESVYQENSIDRELQLLRVNAGLPPLKENPTAFKSKNSKYVRQLRENKQTPVTHARLKQRPR